MPLASVLAVLLAVNLLTNRLVPGLYLPTCVVAAAVLLLIARRAGLSWAELGLGRASLRSGLRWPRPRLEGAGVAGVPDVDPTAWSARGGGGCREPLQGSLWAPWPYWPR